MVSRRFHPGVRPADGAVRLSHFSYEQAGYKYTPFFTIKSPLQPLPTSSDFLTVCCKYARDSFFYFNPFDEKWEPSQAQSQTVGFVTAVMSEGITSKILTKWNVGLG